MHTQHDVSTEQQTRDTRTSMGCPPTNFKPQRPYFDLSLEQHVLAASAYLEGALNMCSKVCSDRKGIDARQIRPGTKLDSYQISK